MCQTQPAAVRLVVLEQKASLLQLCGVHTIVSTSCRALPFKIPYPVPFKLLGDETKGWIDITYLSSDGTFRLTRGNKGAAFDIHA